MLAFVDKLTTLELDLLAAGGCQDPDCRHEDHRGAVLRCREHRLSGVDVTYWAGELAIRCHACHRELTVVLVAGPGGMRS